MKQFAKDNMVIGGAMNAQMGKDHSIMTFHQDTDRNVRHLINMLMECELICTSTKFREWPGKFWIFSNLSNRKAKSDHILINKTNKKL